MRCFLVILFLLLKFSAFSQSSLLVNKTWSYRKVAIIYQQDTLLMFHSDSALNMWYLGKVSLSFKANNAYTGTDIKGVSKSGTWSMPTAATIIVDQDTNHVASLSSSLLSTTSVITYQSSETLVSGTLITQFYPTPSVVSQCESLQSGDWTNSATWSCGHEPTVADVAIINLNHIVTVSTSTAQAQRIIYNGGALRFAAGVAKIFIKGGD